MEVPEFLKKLGIDEHTDPNNPNTWSDTLKSKHASHLEVLKESNPEAYVKVAPSKSLLTEPTTSEVTETKTPIEPSPCDYCGSPVLFNKVSDESGLWHIEPIVPGSGSNHTSIWCENCGKKGPNGDYSKKESTVEEPVTVEEPTTEEPVTDTPTSPTFGGSKPFWVKDDPNWTPPTVEKPKKAPKTFKPRKASVRKDLFDSAPTSTFKVTMDNGQPIEEFPSDLESFERKFPTSPRTPMPSASARFKNMQDAILLSQMAEGNRQSTEKNN